MNFNRTMLMPFESNQQGFLISEFIVGVDESFKKNTFQEIKIFFNKYENITKWFIFSDYALYDKNKPNDVITFSIVPYIYNFDDYKNILNNLAPNDLKKMKKINNIFIQFLNDTPILNISFILSKYRKLDYLDEKIVFKKKVQNAINMFEMWSITTPKARDRYMQSIKNFSVLKDELEKKTPNLKLLRDLDILATLTSYISYQIIKIGTIKLLSWNSDRDSLLNFKKKNITIPFIFELVSAYYHIFCENSNLQNPPKLIFGISDNENKLWYEEFNRIADLIAGTLADYNFEKNEHSHKKFLKVSELLLTNREQVKIFKIDFNKNGSQTSRIEIFKNSH